MGNIFKLIFFFCFSAVFYEEMKGNTLTLYTCSLQAPLFLYFIKGTTWYVNSSHAAVATEQQS